MVHFVYFCCITVDVELTQYEYDRILSTAFIWLRNDVIRKVSIPFTVQLEQVLSRAEIAMNYHTSSKLPRPVLFVRRQPWDGIPELK